MRKFRLPRKTKKTLKYFRSGTSKEDWRRYYKKHYSWRVYIKKNTFAFYSYSQKGWDQFRSDREKDFECENCGKGVFEWGGYPNYHKEYQDLLCDDCYDDKFRTSCPICEDSYDNDEMTEHFFITKEISKIVHKEPGLYKILEYPFYYGDCVTGFDAFFDNALEKVSGMDISKVGKMLGIDYDDVKLDCICPDCLIKYTRKDNFIKALPLYTILHKKSEKECLKNSSKENLSQGRMKMIHERVNFRGLLQQLN
ncbi:hypothetical protein GGR21_002490 [Dysgonomonas hofstadii]|uniref:Uncharacterized protein n=1 Tax=Dysgonomonas hofstadii TaxID=637886 RepID=A0A840CSG0_9BACT|nr:hypothetical protein [Dysgonomonas hofstadii]MBB4036584.1 hypothetical protein [Dysgonomonas hofstadii]